LNTILSIDSATRSGSVALHQDGKLIGLQQYEIDKSHSSLLHVIIDQLIRNCGISKSDLDAIAVSAGPGSYTGLRIGVSSAKGLCFALDKPLIAVNTLEAMAKQVSNLHTGKALFCPMIDARRLEVYSMMLDDNLTIIQETEAIIVEENSFNKYLDENRVVFFGDGSDKCKTILNNENAIFLENIVPSAKEIGELANKKNKKEDFENLAYYEPFYLKEFRIIKSKKKLF
jgi:tRNA threonylcarbamoyladenosine biosynthesis protein TsaB